MVHVLLDDEAVARCRAALERAGMGIADEREVFVIDVEDRPANVNADLAYTTFTGGKIVIATATREALAPCSGRPCNMLQQGLVSTACCQEDRTCDPLQSMHRPGVLNLAWTERLSGLWRGVRSRPRGLI